MLANKYRPQTFEDVVGQNITVKILTKLKERLPPALLFTGSAGCGKTTCARILAQDKECIEIDCASHNGVADVKEILSLAKKPSLIGKHKVYILDEAHTLSSVAWSSFLIPLEENWKHVTFIFCTTEAHKIPDTIFSRVMSFSFRGLNEKDIFNALKKTCEKENIIITDEALSLIAEHSNGNLRTGFSILDKLNFLSPISLSTVEEMLGVISSSDIGELFHLMCFDRKKACEKIREYYYKGYSVQGILESALSFYIKGDSYREIKFLLRTLEKIKQVKNQYHYLCGVILVYDWRECGTIPV